VLPQLAKSQPFIERERGIEHLHVNAAFLPAASGCREDILQDCAADTGVAVLRQQRPASGNFYFTPGVPTVVQMSGNATRLAAISRTTTCSRT
jgi:hypothetical protein